MSANVQMYFFDTKQNNLPHIHAKYQNFSAIIAIESGEFTCFKGDCYILYSPWNHKVPFSVVKQ